MIVIDKNEGPKLAYKVKGNKLTLGDDEITLNLERYEQDYAQHIDVVRDTAGCLATSIGAAAEGLAYAAQIDIPARAYIDVPAPAEMSHDGEDPGTIPEPVPFDMDKVTLTLWAIE